MISMILMIDLTKVQHGEQIEARIMAVKQILGRSSSNMNFRKKSRIGLTRFYCSVSMFDVLNQTFDLIESLSN